MLGSLNRTNNVCDYIIQLHAASHLVVTNSWTTSYSTWARTITACLSYFLVCFLDRPSDQDPEMASSDINIPELIYGGPNNTFFKLCLKATDFSLHGGAKVSV